MMDELRRTWSAELMRQAEVIERGQALLCSRDGAGTIRARIVNDGELRRAIREMERERQRQLLFDRLRDRERQARSR